MIDHVAKQWPRRVTIPSVANSAHVFRSGNGGKPNCAMIAGKLKTRGQTLHLRIQVRRRQLPRRSAHQDHRLCVATSINAAIHPTTARTQHNQSHRRHLHMFKPRPHQSSPHAHSGAGNTRPRTLLGMTECLPIETKSYNVLVRDTGRFTNLMTEDCAKFKLGHLMSNSTAGNGNITFTSCTLECQIHNAKYT